MPDHAGEPPLRRERLRQSRGDHPRRDGALERIQLTNSRQYRRGVEQPRKSTRARGDNGAARALLLSDRWPSARRSRSGELPCQHHPPESWHRRARAERLRVGTEYDSRALSMREQMLGADHLDIAPLLNNLAIIYHATGDDARALSFHFRALRSGRTRPALPCGRRCCRSATSRGPTHRRRRRERACVSASCRRDSGNADVARADDRLRTGEARVHAEHRRAHRPDDHLSSPPGAREPDATSLAALVLLQRKGRVLDAMTDVFAAVRQHADNAEIGPQWTD